MSKSTTYVLMIVDMSGSMFELAADVRGGFNAYVENLRQDEEREYRLTVTLFDHRFMPLCTAAPLDQAPKLDTSNYSPYGSTALCDAIGRTVLGFEARTTVRDDDRVLVVVQTDGQENASREFNRHAIAELIKQHEQGQQWAFVYLGAGPNAWAGGGGLGFRDSRTIRTDSSSAATSGSYAGLAATTRLYASGSDADESVTLTADELRRSGATGEIGD